MEKTEIILEQPVEIPRIKEKEHISPKLLQRKLHLKELGRWGVFCFMGFCWSQGEVLHILHPMGLAYLSLFFGEGALFWAVFGAVAAGSLGGMGLKAGAALAAVLAIQLTLGRFTQRQDMLKKALLGAFATALAGVFYAISQNGLIFYFAVGAVESALVLGISLMTQKGAVFLWEKQKFPVPTKEETLGMLLLLGGTLAGVSTMKTAVFPSGILPFLTAFFIAASAWRDGMGGGAAAGLLLGFFLYLCGGIDVYLLAMLGISGLLAGTMKDLGRFAITLALVITPIIFMFYANQEFSDTLFLAAWGCGGLLFCVVPKKGLTMVSGEYFRTETAKDRFVRKKEVMEERLQQFGEAFTVLAKTFVGTEEEEVAAKKDVSKLVDAIAEEACRGCGLAHYCWEEELYQTYSMTFSALSYCESKGRAGLEQMPASFRETCARGQLFMDTINRIYESYRRDRIWLARLAECRELVGQQMYAVSDILEDLSGHLETNCVFLEQPAQLLKEECMKANIRLKDVRVMEEKNGQGLRVRLEMRGCGGGGMCKSKLLPLVKKVLGRPMAVKNGEVCHGTKDGQCILTFTEIPTFQLSTATAFSSAEEGMPSGDAAAFLETEDGVALMALSDGMGQGRGAAAESRTAIELLEQFTEAGFERDMAVRMINSALLLRRGEESYATLDICAVDLFSAKAEFVKLGAVSSYISRGGRILSVTAHTLPAGIMKQVQVVKNQMPLKDGDMIILLTDGITDALGGEGLVSAWLKEKLEQFPMANPQDVADFILKEAKAMQKEGAGDDMTVLAGRFWQKRKSA